MVSLQPKLSLKVSQRQILTPGLMQMVSVLALNKLELKDMIQAEIAENPVLEELEETVPMIDHVAEPDQQAVAAEVSKADPFEEIDFGSYFQEYLDPGFRSPQSFEVNEKPSLESYLSKPGSLQDHLCWQIGSLSLAPSVRDAVEYIAGNLNEDGYLSSSEEDLLEGYRAQLRQHLASHPDRASGAILSQALAHAEETLVVALSIVRGLDPVGIGARDLRECLLAQVQAARVASAAQQSRRERSLRQERSEQHGEAGNRASGNGEPGNGQGWSGESANDDHTWKETETGEVAGLAALRSDGVARSAWNGRVRLSPGQGRPESELSGDAGHSTRNGWPFEGENGETETAGVSNGSVAGNGAGVPSSYEPSAPHPQSAIYNIAERIVDKHLQLLQKRDLRELARAVNSTVEQANLAFDFIRTLDPRPGQRFNRVDARLIEPDVAFVKRDDEYVAVMDDESVPSLRLNHGYRRLLKQATAEKDVKDYVKERYRSALQLMRNIEQRKNTILRTCEVIVRRQVDFLERGVEALRPMMIKEVAEEIGVHPSTVSRAVSNKYVRTPQGVFELRFFFTEGVSGPEGSGTPLLLLKRKVKKLIEEEDPRKPLTDELITHMLQSQGIDVTRRTVAKYREDLRIPSTHQRRVRD
jgi:DNA-directed RNA polymerase specialized sigma54-like protein